MKITEKVELANILEFHFSSTPSLFQKILTLRLSFTHVCTPTQHVYILLYARSPPHRSFHATVESTFLSIDSGPAEGCKEKKRREKIK